MELKGNILKNKVLWIVLGVALIAALGTSIYLYLNQQGFFRDKNVLATVGNKKITQKDLNEYIYGEKFEGSPENPPEKSFEEKSNMLDTLVDLKIVEIEANKMGINVSEEEISKRIDDNLGKAFQSYNDKQKELTKKAIRIELKMEKLKDKVLGWREGQYIVARFDSTYERDKDMASPQVQEELRKEKEVAKSLIEQIYSDVKSGKITFEQGMERADGDLRIGRPNWGEGAEAYNFSGQMTKEFSQYRGVFTSSKGFWDEIYKAKLKEITEPKVFSIKSDVGEHEAFFAILRMDNGNDSNYYQIEDWLESKKKELNVKYFKENLRR